MEDIKVLFRSNDIVMESLFDMRACQDLKDRRYYLEMATESVLSPGKKSKMIQQLYTDIVSKSNIDFGKIPNSKGDFVSYANYENMSKSLGYLNQLFEGKHVKELKLANRVYDLLISNRYDFEFGFKFDITLIQVTYNLLVLGLYDLINICIVGYVDYLKNVKDIDFKFRGVSKDKLIVVKALQDFVTSFDNGEWGRLMKTFKQESSNLLGFITGGTLALSGAKLVLVSIFAALVVIRALIYVYYSSAMKINERVKITAQFVDAAISYSQDNTEDSLAKQQKMLDTLTSISDFIETRILKVNKDAEKEISKSNKEKFNPKALSELDNEGIVLL